MSGRGQVAVASLRLHDVRLHDVGHHGTPGCSRVLQYIDGMKEETIVVTIVNQSVVIMMISSVAAFCNTFAALCRAFVAVAALLQRICDACRIVAAPLRHDCCTFAALLQHFRTFAARLPGACGDAPCGPEQQHQWHGPAQAVSLLARAWARLCLVD